MSDHTNLTARMRSAAQALVDATERLGDNGSEFTRTPTESDLQLGTWSPDALMRKADEWEAEDKVRADARAAKVHTLSSLLAAMVEEWEPGWTADRAAEHLLDDQAIQRLYTDPQPDAPERCDAVHPSTQVQCHRPVGHHGAHDSTGASDGSSVTWMREPSTTQGCGCF